MRQEMASVVLEHVLSRPRMGNLTCVDKILPSKKGKPQIPGTKGGNVTLDGAHWPDIVDSNRIEVIVQFIFFLPGSI